MSAYLKFSYDIEYDGTYNTCRMDLFVDTSADLAGLAFFDGIKLLPGSSAKDIATGDEYLLNGSGIWIKQPSANQFENVYTKSEVDTMVSDINDDITDLQDQDSETLAAVSELINDSGKNAAQITSGSDTRYVKMGLDIPAGDYVLTIGEISSTDTDATVCRIAVANSADNAIYAGGTTRGTDKLIEFSISEPAAFLYVYASDNYNHSSGDTVTITDLMVCSASYYEITETFTEYCPTLPKLYDLFTAELAGLNTLVGAGI